MTSETEEAALAPCPFCGCDRIYERGFRCFECPECRAEGPTKATKAEAVAAWNTRAAPSRAPEAEDRLADEKQEVVAALYKAWPDAEDIPSDWPLGIIGCIEQIISERDEALAGGKVYLTCVGGQPPVALRVGEAS